MYLVFLLMFTYVMLCDFYPVKVSSADSNASGTSEGISVSGLEVLVIIWVYTYLVKELQMVRLLF